MPLRLLMTTYHFKGLRPVFLEPGRRVDGPLNNKKEEKKMDIKDCFESMVEAFRSALEKHTGAIEEECEVAEQDARTAAILADDDDPITEIKVSVTFTASIYANAIELAPEFKIGHNGSKKAKLPRIKLDNSTRLPGFELKKAK